MFLQISRHLISRARGKSHVLTAKEAEGAKEIKEIKDHASEISETKKAEHRNLGSGTARAAVFGISDGLISNGALILGIAGASTAQGTVRLAGLAGLIAGAISMASGEYVSMKAQSELYERELKIESHELEHNTEVEILELTEIYASRGVSREAAEEMARAVMNDPELALEVHAREELGIDPKELGSPTAAASVSFMFFAIGAFFPLLPWFYSSGETALVQSIIFGIAASLTVGALLALFTGKSYFISIARQVAITAIAASITYLIGSAVGGIT